MTSSSIFFFTGKDAEHAANVFYYLTYEGSVNLDSVDDPVAKEVCTLKNSISSFKESQLSVSFSK